MCFRFGYLLLLKEKKVDITQALFQIRSICRIGCLRNLMLIRHQHWPRRWCVLSSSQGFSPTVSSDQATSLAVGLPRALQIPSSIAGLHALGVRSTITSTRFDNQNTVPNVLEGAKQPPAEICGSELIVLYYFRESEIPRIRSVSLNWLRTAVRWKGVAMNQGVVGTRF